MSTESVGGTLGTVAKTVLPGGVVTLDFLGVPVSQWALLATIIFTVLQTFFLLKDRVLPMIRKRKGGKDGRRK